MRTAFRKKLLIVVGIAVFVVSLFSLDIVDRNCRIHVGKLFLEGYKDTARSLTASSRQSYELRSNMMRSTLSALETAAEVVDSFPSVLGSDSKVLLRMCSGLGLVRIDVIDPSKGIVAASSDPAIAGKPIKSDMSAPCDPSSDFYSFVRGISTYRNVDYVIDSHGRELLLFSTPLSRRSDILIRLGVKADDFKITYDIASNQIVSLSLPIGESGGIDIAENGIIKNSLTASLIGRRAEEVYQGLKLSDYKDESKKEETPKEKILLPSKRAGTDIYYSVYVKDRFAFICFMPVSEVYATRRTVLSAMLVIYFILFLAIFFAASGLVRTIMLDGLERINSSLAEIEAGDLDVKVNENSYPEFSVLSQGINSTVDALKKLMERQIAHDAEQMELAKTIQLSCLPKYFPTYPELKSMDLCAMTELAQEVGGDFYDYFRISDSLYCVMIADVSEHGIPAALLMMTAKTAIRDAVLSGDTLEECMESVNFSLCENNAAGMFVTAFVAVLNIETGEFKFVNAGHCRPILCRRGGKWQEEKIGACFVLGGMDNLSYTSQSWKLCPGDKVFLYTDGVTEAVNSKGELFGVSGLLDVLNDPDCREYDPASCIQTVKSRLEEFCDRGCSSPGDDVTMLAFEYFGSEYNKNKFLEVRCDSEELDNVIDFIENVIDESGIAPGRAAAVKMAVNTVVDDIFTNITSYSGSDSSCRVIIRAEVQKAPRQLIIHFIDNGRPYDPTIVEAPDINLGFEERAYGGLGIHLVKNLTDQMTYRYKDGCNILRLIKKL